MIKEILKTFFFGEWQHDVIDYLSDDIYVPELLSVPKHKTLMDKIIEERNYRAKRMRIIPRNEIEKIYLEETMDMSRARELKLISRLENGSGFRLDVDRARDFPIEELIQFRNGFAKCLWHADTSPSLHWFKKANRAHCFSCSRSFDSIDAAQKIFSLSFKEAVKKLIS